MRIILPIINNGTTNHKLLVKLETDVNANPNNMRLNKAFIA